MKFLWFIFAILLLAIIIFGKPLNDEILKLSISEETSLKTIPTFSVKNLYSDIDFESESIKAGNFDKLYVHFWATWCGPCEIELGQFLNFAKKSINGEKKIFLLVSVLDNKNDVLLKLKNFEKQENQNKIYFVFDGDGSVAKKFGSLKLPETYYFDQNKKLLKKYLGPQEWDSL
jgi:cytochrome c biogenesis protein CcmG/thiol:disulfide interchange protein DsbE